MATDGLLGFQSGSLSSGYLGGITLENKVADRTIEVSDLVKSSFKSNPIDWGELVIDEDELLKEITRTILGIHKKLNKDTKEMVLLAAVIKLNMEIAALKLHKNELQKTIMSRNKS